MKTTTLEAAREQFVADIEQAKNRFESSTGAVLIDLNIVLLVHSSSQDIDKSVIHSVEIECALSNPGVSPTIWTAKQMN